MNAWFIRSLLGAVCAGLFGLGNAAAQDPGFRYESNLRASSLGLSYSGPDPAPRMMEPSEAVDTPRRQPERGYLYPRTRGDRTARCDAYSRSPGSPGRGEGLLLRASDAEPVPAGVPIEPYPDQSLTGDSMQDPSNGELANESFDESYDGRGCAGGCDYQGGFFHWLFTDGRKAYLFSPALWQNFNEFGGVQAFKGPVDRGVNGNFGFHKGVNWASPLWDAMGIGYQLGGQIAVSDFEGGAGVVNKHRDQYFVTTGLFRRAACNQGLQGGAVLDYLHDDFYVRMNLLQVRAEISYLCEIHEFGFWAAVHTKSDTQIAPTFLNQQTVTWQSNDQYNLFYRRRFCNGGVGRMWAGFTSHGDGILGSDATAPLSERWAIQASYNYLLPRADPTIPNSIKESWGVMVGLVWYPGYKVPNACFNPYRPLFNVADNGTFMLTEKQ